MLNAVIGLLMSLAPAFAEHSPPDPVLVDLGGMRQATAIIRPTDADWLIAVRMLPVQSFDQSTNATINRDKARQFALQALARHLAAKAHAGIAVQGVTIEGSGLDGAAFELRLRVPQHGVKSLGNGQKPPASTPNNSPPEQVAFTSALFTREGDYRQTLERLSGLLADKLLKAAKVSGNAFDLRIAELEEEGGNDFERIKKEIELDRLLLAMEKDELLRIIKDRARQWIGQLEQTVNSKSAETPVQRSVAPNQQFTDVQIERSFRTCLLGNPLLMEASGVKVVRLSDGSRVIVAVASTVLKDRSGEERLRAEKVCRVKALASIVAENEGVQLAHLEQVSERTIIVLEGTKEKAHSISELLQITKTEVRGWTKDMPVVGRWNSKDGTVFYLAVGMIVDRTGRPVGSR